MGMGIVTNSEFESDLINSSDKSIKSIPPVNDDIKSEVIVGEIVDSPSKGRGTNNVGVPNSLRNIIGEESILNGRKSAIDLASRFNVSPSSVSAYTEGATSTATINNRPNKPFLDKSKIRITKRAMTMLGKAIDNITDSKLLDASPVELSMVARSMSTIVKDMSPDSEDGNKGNIIAPQFHIYNPGFKKEDSYETIYVKE